MMDMLSMESDSEDDVPRPALPLPAADALPPDHEGPPTTADQYLALVRQEAAALPNVFVSRLNPPNPPSPPPSKPPASLHRRLRLPDTPSHLLPHARWQSDLVHSFASLQRGLTRPRPGPIAVPAGVPARGDLQSWRSAVFGERARPPTLSVVLALDHVRVVDALRTVDRELDANGFDRKEIAEKRIVAGSLADQFGKKPCADWVFALLALVLPPISGDTASILRSLLRKATIARLAHDEDVDDDNDAPLTEMHEMHDYQGLARINVLITLLEKHFAQGDVS